MFDSSTQNYIGVIILIIILAAIITALSRYIWKKLHRNEALKYEFITIIAHKFRTPLTTAKWSLGELVTGETDPFKKKSLEEIQQSNEKLIKLTGTLIELTDSDDVTASSYNFEHVGLSEFVRSIAAPFKDIFHEKNIFFSVLCPDTDVYANIDRSRIEFVLQSLLENADAYSTPGGNVDIKISQLGRLASISVTDNGIGIDRADFPNLFTKFFRAKNAQLVDTEGFGVSLYLAKTIMRRHKGSIEVSSPGTGKGATFTLTLPAVNQNNT
jgi:signal transduction histidine kinase